MKDRGRVPREVGLLLALNGLGALGFLVILLATRPGMGISPDSVVYFQGARGLVDGDGFAMSEAGRIVRITQWPPLYPLALAAFLPPGLSLSFAARILGGFLFLGNVVVAGWMVWREAPGRFLPPFLVSALVLVSLPFVKIHVMAWSEPLFLLLVALGVYALSRFFRDERLAWIPAAAFLLGLATVTRYAGVPFLVAAPVAILLLGPGDRARRIWIALGFLALASIPLAVWAARNLAGTETVSGPALFFHSPGLEHVHQAARAVSGWWVPPAVPIGFRLPLLLALFCVTVVAVHRGMRGLRISRDLAKGQPLLFLIPLFVFAYVAFMIAMISFVRAHIPLDFRILSPVHYLTIVFVGLLLGMGSAHGRSIRLAASIALAVLALQAYGTLMVLADPDQAYLEFNRRALREAPIWPVLRDLPEGTRIYSNVPDLIYLHTERTAGSIPAVRDPATRRAVDPAAKLHRIDADLSRGSGRIVMFDSMEWRDFLLSEERIQEHLSLVEELRFEGVRLYRAADRPAMH